jgi:hypothetical protein
MFDVNKKKADFLCVTASKIHPKDTKIVRNFGKNFCEYGTLSLVPK